MKLDYSNIEQIRPNTGGFKEFFRTLLEDFLGGQGAYIELLDCFEQAGIELRPEIDEYFGKFDKKSKNVFHNKLL